MRAAFETRAYTLKAIVKRVGVQYAMFSRAVGSITSCGMWQCQT